MNYIDENERYKKECYSRKQVDELIDGVYNTFGLDIRLLKDDILDAIERERFELVIDYPIDDTLFKPIVTITTHKWKKTITQFGYPVIMDI